MRNLLLLIFLLGFLLLLPLVFAGCGDDAETFQLGDCRLGDVDCRLQ